MSLQLVRPIAFLDLETTGVNLSTDRIVEIAIIKILPDGSRQAKRKLLNPQMPIPAVTTAIHGITDEMVKDAPTFKQAGNELKQFIENCDMGGYNSNRFDIPMLMEEFLRAGMDVDLSARRMVDVQHIFLHHGTPHPNCGLQILLRKGTDRCPQCRIGCECND